MDSRQKNGFLVRKYDVGECGKCRIMAAHNCLSTEDLNSYLSRDRSGTQLHLAVRRSFKVKSRVRSI